MSAAVAFQGVRPPTASGGRAESPPTSTRATPHAGLTDDCMMGTVHQPFERFARQLESIGDVSYLEILRAMGTVFPWDDHLGRMFGF
jgi:hypothetical protein